jgi:phosphoglycolate phosphatase
LFLVFDLDGTLIDGYDGITDALGFAMSQLGRTPLGADRVRGMVGEGLERLIERAIGAELVVEGVRLFRERYAEVADAKTRLMPDVPGVLERIASAGHLMAVASNKPADFTRRILAGKGIAGRFAAVGGPGPDVPPKPHPEMLLRLLKATGASAGETLVVGDMEIDAEFARAAGCRAVLVPGGSRSEEELARVPADAHLSRLAELPDWIAREIRSGATPPRRDKLG